MKKKLNRKDFCEEILKLAPSEYDASKCDFREHLVKKFDEYIELLDRLEKYERREKNGGLGMKRKRQLLSSVMR